MKIDFQTNSYKNKLNKKIKLLLNINIKHFLIALYLLQILISYERLEISLIINSNGNTNILNNTFKFNPSEVIVNGIPKDSCSKTYETRPNRIPAITNSKPFNLTKITFHLNIH